MLKLGDFLTLDYSTINLNNREQVLQKARMNDEHWKDEADKIIQDKNNKFKNYFSVQKKNIFVLTNSFYEF